MFNDRHQDFIDEITTRITGKENKSSKKKGKK